MQRPEHLDELVAETVLERDPASVDPARDQQHLFVLDVDALDRPDPLREVEDLRLGERRRGEPATVPLVDDRRVQALLDRGPDRERRGEVVAVDGQVRPVPYAASRRSSRTDGRPRSARTRRTVRARRRCRRARAARCAPSSPPTANCSSPSFTPVRRVRLVRVRARQRHRHVEVVGAGRERAVEDRHHEARVDRVEHVRDAGARGRASMTSSASDASTRAATNRPADRSRRGSDHLVDGSRPSRGRSRRPRSARRSRAGPRWRPRPNRRHRRR